MNCQNCHEPLEPGAAFCGNCGYPVQPAATGVMNNVAVPQAGQPQPTVGSTPQTPGSGGTSASQPPSYAIATANHHAGETPAVLAVIAGVIGIAGSFLIPIIGLVFGVLGLCMGTVSRRMAHRRLGLAGLILSCLAIVAGLGALAYNYQHNKDTTPNGKTGLSNSSSKVLSHLTTPCYSFNLVDQYNISNTSGSCDASAYNGTTFENSTIVYKIVATNAGTVDPGTFAQLAKAGIEKDIHDNLPTFKIDNEGSSSFAGSIAYSAHASDQSQGTAIIETLVLHPTSKGDNVFDLVHAINGTSVDLQTLEAQWQWK